jgi:Tetratricopeptide repeat
MTKNLSSTKPFIHMTAVLLLSFSCGRIEDKVTDDQLVIELLNTGRYHEAARVLEAQISANPGNSLARLRLASAYAGESGFNLIDAYSAFEPLIAPGKEDPQSKPQARTDSPSPSTTDSSRDSESTNDDDRAKLKRFERNLLVSALDSEVLMKVLFNLPYLGDDKRDLIMKAISVLEKIPKDYNQVRVSQIYQGVLQFLLASNFMRDGFVGITNAPNERNAALTIYCGLDLKAFLHALPPTIGHLTASLSAVASAGSDQNSRFFGNAARALKSASSLQTFYLEESNIFNLAEAGNRTFKDRLCESQ